MKGCWEEHAPCRVSHHDNPKRKLKYTLEQVCMDGHWLMVNTALPNAVVATAIENDEIPELMGYGHLRREQSMVDKTVVSIFCLRPWTGKRPRRVVTSK